MGWCCAYSRQRLVAEASRQHDHAVHTPGHQGIQRLPFTSFVPHAADKQRDVAHAGQFVLDAVESLAVEGAADRLRDDADAHRAPTGQSARHRVGPKAQVADGLLHRLLLGRADGGTAIEDARNRAGGHASGLRHHVQSHRAITQGEGAAATAA
jgi:hypothetical protein